MVVGTRRKKKQKNDSSHEVDHDDNAMQDGNEPQGDNQVAKRSSPRKNNKRKADDTNKNKGAAAKKKKAGTPPKGKGTPPKAKGKKRATSASSSKNMEQTTTTDDEENQVQTPSTGTTNADKEREIPQKWGDPSPTAQLQVQAMQKGEKKGVQPPTSKTALVADKNKSPIGTGKRIAGDTTKPPEATMDDPHTEPEHGDSAKNNNKKVLHEKNVTGENQRVRIEAC